MGVKCLRASLLEEFTYREFMQELHVTIQFQIKIKNKANASVKFLRASLLEEFTYQAAELMQANSNSK